MHIGKGIFFGKLSNKTRNALTWFDASHNNRAIQCFKPRAWFISRVFLWFQDFGARSRVHAIILCLCDPVGELAEVACHGRVIWRKYLEALMLLAQCDHVPQVPCSMTARDQSVSGATPNRQPSPCDSAWENTVLVCLDIPPIPVIAKPIAVLANCPSIRIHEHTPADNCAASRAAQWFELGAPIQI